MTTQPCADMALLIQAELDGELPTAETARLQQHLEQCDGCAAIQSDLLALSTRLRAAALYDAAPAALRETLAAARAPVQPVRWHRAGPAVGWFGLGVALAASLMLAVLPPSGSLPDAVVAAHIRALQPGHLMDVPSTDRHTVKPWFDGRLPFAPPVKDLAASGFPLAGGRLEYLAGHDAASLIYRAGPHLIDLFIWPGSAACAAPEGAREGYNFICWNAAGMQFWAVSDLNAAELAGFVSRWRGD